MFKKLFSVFILFLLLASFSVIIVLAEAQVSWVEWTKTIGGANDDQAHSIVETADGGYAIGGYTNSFGAGSEDFLLIKTDPEGNVEWNQTYGGAGADSAYSMVQTSDGGYALAGETYSYGAGDSDFWLVKVDSFGSMQWNKTYGEPTAERANAIIQTNDGGYVLAGYSTGKNASNDLWFVKTDSMGNMQWNRTYGGSRWDDADSVIQTNDGGYMLAGTTNSLSDDTYIPHDCWLVKTNSDGNMEWNKTYDKDGGSDGANSLLQTSDGGYILAGHTGGFIGQNVWVIKTDSDGNRIWDVIWSTREPARTSSLIQTSDGGYAITGRTDSLDGYAGMSSYLFLVKVDVNGNIQWNSTYEGLGDNKALFAVQMDNDGYAMAGTTRSTEEGSYYDIWFIKVDPYGTIIPEFSSWTLILITLTVVIAMAVIYRSKLLKQNQRGRKQ